ncbi:MAG: hypothetical protein M0R80_26275 [Proteobacteria bacterium]|jgi:hypothetical protein|nr:hypothetical protein [Pseudomonadota bacterium]
MFTYSSLALPNPQFEDTRRISLNNIIRAGRFLSIYKSAGWPTIKTFLYKFLIHDCQVGTTGSLVESFKQKLITTAGTKITWIDHIGVSREGFLVTDEPEFVTVATDWVEVTIELMEDVE